MTLPINFDRELPKPSYYNTLNLSKDEVEKWRETNAGQDAKVLGFFMDHPHSEFNAWEVHDGLNGQIFITNVRRAINTFLKRKWIEQVGENTGKKGHPNFTYRFKNKKP